MATTFDRARRQSDYRRLARVVGAHGDPDLLTLEEATRRLRPFHRRYVGLRPIPLQQIVGTDSRGGDFDRDFLPRRPDIGERWRRVEQAFPEGDFPPIVVYRLGDAYFVVDGHHRVAIARQRGVGRALAPAKIAGDWYERVYFPAVETIRREGLDEAYPEATDADLFLCVYQRRRELFPDCGCPRLEETARRVIQEGRKSTRWSVRGPLRGQTTKEVR